MKAVIPRSRDIPDQYRYLHVKGALVTFGDNDKSFTSRRLMVKIDLRVAIYIFEAIMGTLKNSKYEGNVRVKIHRSENDNRRTLALPYSNVSF